MAHVEQTSDDVCRALGLPGFATRWTHAAPDQEMRLLLLPTFHPEICLTFSERDAVTSATVICAQTKIPLEQSSPPTVDQETGQLRNTTLADLEVALRTALAEPDHLTLGRDGMPVCIFWRTFNAQLVVEYANPDADSALGAFVGRVITDTYRAITLPACKDCLNEAGIYLGLNLASSQGGA